MKPNKILFFFYNRLNDPLLQSNIFQYIREMTDRDKHPYEIAIITFEDNDLELSKEEKRLIGIDFNKRNIKWYPLKWHKGDSLYIKLWDLIIAFLWISKLRLKGFKNIVSLGSIAGSFVYLISRLIPIDYYLYQYEPHSEYAVDNNIWTKESRQYRALNYLERKALMNCKVVSSGTEYMKKRIEEWKIKKPFFKVASVVNDVLFEYSPSARERIRESMGIKAEQKLVIYPGKIGDLYADARTILSLFNGLYEKDKNFRFLLITSYEEQIKSELAKLSESFISAVTLISPVPYTEMPSYLSAGDIGLVSVLPGPSKKFISNIKVGEYLCSGLPYIICKGISEDDLVAERDQVGLVLDDLNVESILKQYERLKQLLNEPKLSMVSRCRLVGIDYRGFKKQYKEFDKAIGVLVNK